MSRCQHTVFPDHPAKYLCAGVLDAFGHCANPECGNRVGVASTHGPLPQEVKPLPVESHLQEDGRVKNGTYTLVSEKSGEHRTLRIATVQNKRSGLHGRRILSMLVGPNNEADYVGFAFVEDDNSIRVWGAFKGTLTGDIGAALMAILIRGKVQSDGYVRAEPLRAYIMFKSACRVCNRPLTCPESIRTGIGPVCAGRSE
jgi:hypothetical protein